MNIHCYDDIINLTHPTSEKHIPMPISDRAAQFSPFAALTGHNTAIKETARITDKKIELDDDTMARLDEKLLIIEENIGAAPRVVITYFLPDERKDGGKYISYEGCIKRIDRYARTVIMTDQTDIPIDQISDIESDIFCDTEYI